MEKSFTVGAVDPRCRLSASVAEEKFESVK